MTHDELLLFGERLHSRRKLLNFTQDFVSEKAGISLRFYQMIERGEKSVSLDTLIRLSDILTISVDYLLFGNLSYSLDKSLNGSTGWIITPPPRGSAKNFAVILQSLHLTKQIKISIALFRAMLIFIVLSEILLEVFRWTKNYPQSR